MSEPVVYSNGEWLPRSRAGIALNDAGFVMGATITDFVRTFRLRLDHWPEHFARFRDNCRALGIDVPGDWTANAEELVRRNAGPLAPGQELVVILFATPGPIGYYLGDPGGLGDAPATLGMHTFPLPFERYRGMIEHGVRLRIPERVRAVPADVVPPNLKHRSRLHWFLADRELARFPGDRPLLVDAAGRVTETAFGNLLIVRGGQVVSPRRETILPGISLGVVEELCRELSIPFAEADLTTSDCQSADEAMLCGSAFCLIRVAAIDGVPIPPGNIFHRLLSAWNAHIGLDIHAQFRESSRDEA